MLIAWIRVSTILTASISGMIRNSPGPFIVWNFSNRNTTARSHSAAIWIAAVASKSARPQAMAKNSVSPGLVRLMARAIARAGYKSRPHEKHLAQISSSDTPVVVMEATEYGDCVDAPLCRERSCNRLLVTEGLVRTRSVVKADVLGDDAPEVILTEDEDVVEQLSPESTGEAFNEGIHVWRAYRRAQDAHPRRPEYASEASAELRVVVADDNLWRVVHGGVSGLLRAPLVGRRIRHRGMEDR